MKMAFRISLLINAALLAALIWTGRLAKPRPEQTTSGAPGAAQSHSASLKPAAGPVPSPEALHPEPAPFRWSQLQSSDYRIFVKNLRAIGCPEATVCAIVTADVEAVYLARARELESRLGKLNQGSWQEQLADAQTVSALKDQLSRLPEEEVAEIGDLLGIKPADVAVPRRRPSPRVQQQPPVAPLVFQDVDPAGLNLSADQQQAIANIRQDFLQQIGGTNQDPNDPAYLARWQTAQPDADNQLQVTLGMDAYLDYQIKANEKMLEDQARQSRP